MAPDEFSKMSREAQALCRLIRDIDRTHRDVNCGEFRLSPSALIDNTQAASLLLARWENDLDGFAQSIARGGSIEDAILALAGMADANRPEEAEYDPVAEHALSAAQLGVGRFSSHAGRV